VLNYANPHLGGFTPLIVACAEGQEGCVRRLLGVVGVNVSARNLHGESALLWASRCGQAACVRLLVQVEAVNLNCSGNNGRSPLDVAKTETVRSTLKEAIEARAENKHLNECVAASERE
jgi:ankyrin repeat protein